MSEHSPGSQHVIVAMLTVANFNNQHRIIIQSVLISIVRVELKIVMSMLSRDFRVGGGTLRKFKFSIKVIEKVQRLLFCYRFKTELLNHTH